jgi:hypothetical protein
MKRQVWDNGQKTLATLENVDEVIATISMKPETFIRVQSMLKQEQLDYQMEVTLKSNEVLIEMESYVYLH